MITDNYIKIRVLPLIFSALFCCISFRANSQNEQILPDAVLPSHPRLLLLKGEENSIIKKIKDDGSWKKIHTAILLECDKIITRPPVERILIGRRLLDKSREALRRIFYLSYGWRTTGDTRYFKRAEEELLAVSSFTDWNPSHFLDVAEMTMAVSIGYDWLYNSLSPRSGEMIRNAIIEKGLKPSLDPKNNSWLMASHNWNQVCNAGMAFGALAVFEDQPDLSSEIINRGSKSIRLPMKDYLPDGAYPEGYSYWGYGTSFNVMYISALEKVFGKSFSYSDEKGFYKTPYFLENMTGPTGNCFNFSDAGSKGGLHPAMFWFAQRLNDPSLLWSERKYLAEEIHADDRLFPAIMIWGTGMNMEMIKAPEKTMWTGMGKNPVALMRTGWTDTDAIYVAMKGGSPKVNHGHMDAGSFVMDANGIRWAMDMGMQDYNSLESKGVKLWGMDQNSQRWEVFRYNNFVHNTLTVNGQLQQVAGYAPIVSSSENTALMNAVTDMVEIYKGELKSARRGIAIVDKKYVVVRDEVETLEKETLIRWTLLTGTDVKITGTNTAELSRNGKKLIIKVDEPAHIEMKTWSTEPTHDYDAKNPGTTLVGFEVSIPANTKATLQVCLLPEGSTQKSPAIAGGLSAWSK